jgi:hypothetical protein
MVGQNGDDLFFESGLPALIGIIDCPKHAIGLTFRYVKGCGY